MYISDKNRAVGRYYEIDDIDKVITDKGLTAILDHVFIKSGPTGEIVIDRLCDDLESYMTEQNDLRNWPDDFYDEQISKLIKLRLQWKKASDGHENKLRKDVAKAIVLRCQ